MKSYIINTILITIIIGLLSSCFKEDEKVYIPPLIGSDEVVLGNSYHTQIWVDLNGFEHKATHQFDIWDLAFSCDNNNFDIRLNSAKSMYAGTNGEKVFENVISEEGIEMNFDASSGITDSLAFRDWYSADSDGNYISHEMVYVVNLGLDTDANELGFLKVQFFIGDQNYRIKYANLDGTEENTMLIPKDDAYNFTHLSFENGIIDIEPPKEEWTLKFSKYSTILKTDAGDPYDYNVVGALLNPYKVTAVQTDTLVHPYELIQLADTASYEFSTQNDIIGYDWKEYRFDEESYVVYSGKSYIVKDRDGYFYKLHFIKFYDDFGNKGSITYQIERL